ncbi:iron uptake porin [Leptolyngbya ectocarpi]|uniref:iron uptake porin n=1 Tax=Leptolyngbya ectocarpi TaxID=1202 RepID=UPI002AD34B27|nr:iron uptake porin [Leptolyngbya ectocarpi]
MFLGVRFSSVVAYTTSVVALSALNLAVNLTGGVAQASSPASSPELDDLLASSTAKVAASDPLPPLLAQVTSVDELSDVSDTDWAYYSLQRLVEEYNCLEGYPSRQFRGTQSLTRYEFAAAVQSCLDGLLGAGIDASSPDWARIRRLAEEFSVDIATVSARVDSLEANVAELEANQFSETTRLFGQAIFGIQTRTENTADFFPVDGVRDTEDPGTAINLISNVQLSLLTELNRDTFLLTGIQAGDGSTTPRLNNDVRLSYEGDSDFNVSISDLTLRHLVSDNLALIAGAEGVNAINTFRGTNRVESAGFGPLSAFAQRNPIIAIGGGDAGLGFDWQMTDRLSLQTVYSASDAADAGSGLFGNDGDKTLALQLSAVPVDSLDLALNYVYSHSPSGNLRTGIGDSQLTAGDSLDTHAFGATAAWDISSDITLGGWGGFTTSSTPGESGHVETTNWMVFLNFPDLFKPGNMGGLYVGQPPKITKSTLRQSQNIPDILSGGLGNPGDQPSTTTHIELFYRHRMSDSFTITPGFFYVINPAHTSDSENVFVGAIRGTFTF